MLRSKHLLITGLVTTDSIAFAVAERAQLMGAELLLTALPRDRELAVEAAAKLPRAVEILDLDVTDPDQVEQVTAQISGRFPRLDGVLHAVAFAPREALAGDFLAAAPDRVAMAFNASSYSYAALARVLRDLAPPEGGSIVGLDFAAEGAWPIYNWMGVCKAALNSINRYVARDLGPQGIRSNLVAAGPLRTRAAGGIPAFDYLERAWEQQAPMAWDPSDPGPVADAVCFLLSDLSRAITGETINVDGGYHAMQGPSLESVLGEDAVERVTAKH